jgi:magnesium chelatase subunit I
LSVAFPFAAIVGQDEMKQALLLATVDASIGGVLVLGDRGTGKSTAVRALASLLPPIKALAQCRYQCDPAGPAGQCSECGVVRQGKPEVISMPVPVVDLPLGATEDRVVGALDLEKALSQGIKAFEPGLLAQANRGFLYIDEVNLLEDHLVDLLIDVAASGENLVERDGLSLRHPARFVLVGSGNPEEGELRPQLLDRFGLSVEVSTPIVLSERVEVIKRRDHFERDRAAFAGLWKKAQDKLRKRVEKARLMLSGIECPDAILEDSARLCIALGTDGLRGELTLMRAARAQAALDAEKVVGRKHLRAVAISCLRHRLRRDPLDETASTVRVHKVLDELLPLAA